MCYEHQRADRVPLRAQFRSEVMQKLMVHFNTLNPREVEDILGIDFIIVGRSQTKSEQEAPRNINAKSGHFRDDRGSSSSDRPLSDEKNLKNYKFPDLNESGLFDDMRRNLPKLKSRYIVMAGATGIFQNAFELRGYQQFLEDLLINQQFAEELISRIYEHDLDLIRRYAQLGVDVIIFGGDIAMQTGMLFSPKIWRLFFKERYAHIIEKAKKYGVKYFYFHSDGNIMEVMDDLIEVGFNIFNPIQPECMDPYEVKRRWGDKIVLDGTISTQYLLPFGSVRDVRKEVRERINRCAQNGGLVIGPSNRVQSDVPLKNILALFDEAKKVGMPK